MQQIKKHAGTKIKFPILEEKIEVEKALGSVSQQKPYSNACDCKYIAQCMQYIATRSSSDSWWVSKQISFQFLSENYTNFSLIRFFATYSVSIQ